MKLEARDAPYQFAGSFYEACDCYSICPCWTGGKPDEGECTGIFAWEIEQGTIDGVDVSGLRAVSVSHHSGARNAGARQRVVIIIDENATQQQSAALVAAFTGSLGGPLEELAELLGELLAVEHSRIMLRREGRLTTLAVGRRRRIWVEGATSEGPLERPITLSDGRLSAVLGSPAEVGESWRMQVGLSGHGMDLDVRGRSSMSGSFSYQHLPAAA
jgi:hypothetical protein